MSQANKTVAGEQMRAEYDIRGGVRGKYYERYRQGTKAVEVEPDVAAARVGRKPRRGVPPNE